MADAPSAAVQGSLWIGAYSLEVAGSGSFARFEPKEERQNARALRAALDKADEPPGAAAAIEGFQESADAVTSRIEKADKLLRTVAAGELLQLGNLSGEIDSLLDLFTRLDKAGRFDEELKLMRSLNGLLSLTLRWLDLIRSLLALLRSARASGHAAGQAFAHHELGSLKLCAGRPEEAARDLHEALRLEEALGDVVGRCATRHNLDSARRDALRRGGFGRPRGIRRLLILAGVIAIAAGSGAGIALAIHGDGNNSDVIGSQATLIVHKDFIPNAPGSTTISVTCTNGGRPDSSPKTVTEAAPAAFKITRFAAGATCTASEVTAPAGYSKVQADCRDVSIATGETRSCTIIDHRKGLTTARLTVRKDFTPNAPPTSAEVSVTCTKGGRPDERQKRVTEATSANFTITRFGKGATCTAVENPAPSGYSQNNADCQNVPIAPGSSVACTITNTRSNATSAIFKVYKDFSDNSSAKVSITLSCDSGAIAESQIGAAEGSPATFKISGFQTGATCTASEGTPPSGYAADESDCQRVPIARASCTIRDTLKETTLTVRKDYTDGNTSGVLVRLDCTSGTIADSQLTASPSSPATFTITAFDANTTCSATEIHYAGSYNRDESDCKDVSLAGKSECTIVNSPKG